MSTAGFNSRYNVMFRDIDTVKLRLKDALPGVKIEQLKVMHPGADGDGPWFIDLPGRTIGVQIESWNGQCPFLVESNLNDDRYHGATVDEVVSRVCYLFELDGLGRDSGTP